MKILVVENCVDYDGIRYCEDEFDDFCLEIGGINILKERKIFAVELPFRVFLNTFYEACKNFIIQKTRKEYKEDAGEGFPLKELSRIRPFLNTFL